MYVYVYRVVGEERRAKVEKRAREGERERVVV